MSNSRLQISGKPENSGSTIGFKFHANEEELEELQSEQDNSGDKNNEINSNLKLNTALLAALSPEASKSDDKAEAIGDAVRDPWNLLGRRSTSVDSTYESPFSNPIETWRKLNVLKEKLTKTVEEKISEMKIDRSRARLINSKENSSISDSEDTSESSRLSETWRDAEDLNSSVIKQPNDNSNMSTNALEIALAESVKKKIEKNESESELRNRKASSSVSDLMNLNNIKISTAKSEIKGNFTEESLGEVESGVEADENMDPTESDSVDFFDDTVSRLGNGGSETPPDGNYFQIISQWGSFLLSEKITAAVIIGFLFYHFFPMSEFFKGFLLCFLLIMFWKAIKYYLQLDDNSFAAQKPLVIPDYKSMPPLKVPEYKPVKGIWMNEYEREFYDPDYYSVTQTFPAYVELENAVLKLSRPKGKINKRATFDEPEYKYEFISQRTYDISGCNVFLMPDGLTRKRLFSKKYPVVIFLRPDSLICEKGKVKIGETNEGTEGTHLTPGEIVRNKSSIYLFARCDRQKEEWYRRLLAATRLSSTPVRKDCGIISELGEEKENSDESPTKEATTPFETLFFDDTAEIEEYLRYMAKFMNEDFINHEKPMKAHGSQKKKPKAKKKDAHHREELENLSEEDVNSVYKKPKSSRMPVDCEAQEESKQDDSYPCPQVQWFNAFINRILFDVFRSPYWLDQIHGKVERKLNSIRLPYYIEDIEVIEMDLGKTGPMFHRVSQPYIDERGLWFDMDTTFDGLIKLTIQTHLNLIKLQKGMEEEEQKLEQGKVKSEKEKESKKEKEKEVKDLNKDLQEASNASVTRKSRKLEKPSSKPSSPPEMRNAVESSSVGTPVNPTNSNLACRLSNDCNLLEEVTKLAEFVVEEGLTTHSGKESKELLGSRSSNKSQKLRSPIYDSEVEDSAESSDEDEEEEEETRQTTHPPSPTSPAPLPETGQDPAPVSTARRYPKNRRSSKRILRVFENVAKSKYFKSVAQSKYVKKAIAGVSATNLQLTLEIKSCTGILAINIPPPPSDRFWYGFREMPKLIFSANPKIGDKTLRFVHIKNYLQKKILHELKKVMVAPNMIDFVLPTSAPARSPSCLQIEQPEMNEEEATPPE